MRLGSARAQALLELALCAPIVILLALGTAAAVQVADARAGLDAATQVAADVAARSADPSSALTAAQQRFASVVAEYPLRSATFSVSVDGFARGGQVVATSSGLVDLGWAEFLLLPSHMRLQSQVVLRLEPWRTHRQLS
jgi:Flp pilus assembly protein TadG